MEHNVHRATDAQIVPKSRAPDGVKRSRAYVVEQCRACAAVKVSILVADGRIDYEAKRSLSSILEHRDKFDFSLAGGYRSRRIANRESPLSRMLERILPETSQSRCRGKHPALYLADLIVQCWIAFLKLITRCQWAVLVPLI